tara:strand:- start:510 stop:1223 length:714 start_codon:yes stop_codon:yes gene_type:complete
MRGFLAILIAIIAMVWVGCEPTGGAVNAEDKEPHFLEGRRQMQQRDFEGAERSFHKALEANPRSSLAHYEIGLLYFTRKSDPAAAIYHLQRYLSLAPDAPKGKIVQGQIEALKGDIARDILGSPQHAPDSAIQQLRTQLNQMAAENQALRHQLQSRGITPNPRTATNSTVQLPRPDSTTPPRPPNSRRKHEVQSGENPTAIARRYGIKLQELYAANPGLNPSKLQIGQELIIPARGQ